MIDTIADALAWFYHANRNLTTFTQQIDAAPNDGEKSLLPITAFDDDFSPKLHNPANERPLLHRHEGFCLLYMYQGACLTAINDKPLMLNDGDILILSPHVLHRNALVNADDLMFHCQLSRDMLCHAILPMVSEDALFSSFILGFIADARNNNYLYFQGVGHKPAIKTAFESILIEYASKRPLGKTIIRCQLASLLTLLSREQYPLAHIDSAQTDGVPFSQITDYISTHYASITLTQMAADFHYHPNYLSALIRKETGKSFSQLVQYYRLARACFLLDKSTFSTEEIAHMVGYKDASSFFKAYKKHFGVSPRNAQL